MAQYDKSLAMDQLLALQALYTQWGPIAFMRQFFWILTKTPGYLPGAEDTVLIPFSANRIQHDLEANLAQRNRVLKGRQQGLTTYLALRRLLLPTILEPGTAGMLVSQSREYVNQHFLMIQRAHNLFGVVNPQNDDENQFALELHQNLLHLRYSNRKELLYDFLDSKVIVASAEVEETGQGVTLHRVVMSEIPRWPGNPEQTVSNIQGAIVPNGTRDEEGTANGAAGYFYEKFLYSWTNPKTADAKAHFYEWWWTPEYRAPLVNGRYMLGTESILAAELEADLQEDERKLMEVYKLDLAQIAFRREMKLVFAGTFDEKFPEDPLTAFLVTGRQFFDRDILKARRMELLSFKPLRSFANGQAQIFKARVPGRRYIIGVDAATGRDLGSGKTDNSAMVVLDFETTEEVAAYCALVQPDELARDAADLGHYYNDAVIAVERTGDGGNVITTLAAECQYSAIYKHKDWHKREKKVVEFEGFPTTPKTRPVAVNMVNRWVRDSPELIHDIAFVDECFVFVRDEKGIPKAATGGHDDRVSARWVALGARAVLLQFWEPWKKGPRVTYLDAERMDEDAVEVPSDVVSGLSV